MRSETLGPKRRLPGRSRLRSPHNKIPGARKARFPDFLRPQLATLVDFVPKGEEWLHEIKFDGYRILCRIDNRQATLLTREGKDWTTRFEVLARAAKDLPVRQALLDGELVALAADGRSNFQLLQNSLQRHNGATLAYFAFDLLYLNGWDLTQIVLRERKKLLQKILRTNRKRETLGRIRYSEHWIGRGDQLYAESCRKGLEGIVSKKANQPYRSGRGRDWLKVKCSRNQEFVIGGFTEPSGSRSGLGALLVGMHDDSGHLRYAGKVGTGFTRQSLKDLRARLDSLRRKSSPFSNPPRGSETRGVHWVEPKLVGAVAFSEWTSDNLLRHPSFQGLREDKPAAAINREKVSHQKQSAGSSVSRKVVEVAGIKLSHPDRIFYPEQGITKLDLARYYEAVADWMLPHLEGRPLTLVRCPKGFSQPCFYQRYMTQSMREPIRSISVGEGRSTVSYVSVDSTAGLVALAQMGVLEIHTWGSRRERIEQPDRLIFDLDPDPALPWKRIREAAETLRVRLSALGFIPYVKTTGGKGLHVVVPVTARYGWETVKSLTKSIALELVHEAPDLYTATLSKAKRRGKIYLDYLRNTRTATAVSAYSTRAGEHAPVSVPVDWDELSSDVRANHFTIHNVLRRLARLRRDPWESYETSRRTIPNKLVKAQTIKE